MNRCAVTTAPEASPSVSPAIAGRFRNAPTKNPSMKAVILKTSVRVRCMSGVGRTSHRRSRRSVLAPGRIQRTGLAWPGSWWGRPTLRRGVGARLARPSRTTVFAGRGPSWTRAVGSELVRIGGLEAGRADPSKQNSRGSLPQLILPNRVGPAGHRVKAALWPGLSRIVRFCPILSLAWIVDAGDNNAWWFGCRVLRWRQWWGCRFGAYQGSVPNGIADFQWAGPPCLAPVWPGTEARPTNRRGWRSRTSRKVLE